MADETGRSEMTESEDRYRSVTGPKDPGAASKGTGETDFVEVRRATNGGFIVKCFKKPPKSSRGGMSVGMEEPESYVFPDLAGVNTYLGQEFGQPSAPAQGTPPARPAAPPARPAGPPASTARAAMNTAPRRPPPEY